MGSHWNPLGNKGHEPMPEREEYVSKFSFDRSEQREREIKVSACSNYENQLARVTDQVRFESLRDGFNELGMLQTGCRWRSILGT